MLVTEQYLVPIDFYSIFFTYYGSLYSSKYILCSAAEIKMYTFLEQLEASKW